MRKAFIAACFLACGTFASAASAEIVVQVNKARQSMSVFTDGRLAYVWSVSTAGQGYSTPEGEFYPIRLSPDHRSGRSGVPMPYSIFFVGGYAIHGTYEVGYLGYPASHGCVRLHPNNAAALFDLVSNSNSTRIIIGWW